MSGTAQTERERAGVTKTTSPNGNGAGESLQQTAVIFQTEPQRSLDGAIIAPESQAKLTQSEIEMQERVVHDWVEWRDKRRTQGGPINKTDFHPLRSIAERILEIPRNPGNIILEDVASQVESRLAIHKSHFSFDGGEVDVVLARLRDRRNGASHMNGRG